MECHICGQIDFYVVDGFYYCAECQTQSKNVQQQALDYIQGSRIIKKKSKSRNTRRSEKSNTFDYGNWTSWEAYNISLYGMVQELITQGAPPEIELICLELWAFYLQYLEVAFTSFTREKLPLLSYPYNLRDAKVIYDLDRINFCSLLRLNSDRRRKRKKVKKASSDSNISILSSKRKMRQLDYESSLSEAHSSDDTLESLSSSQKSEEVRVPRVQSCYMTSKGYRLHKIYDRRRRKVGERKRKGRALYSAFKKSTLLALMWLSLLLSNSEIQLSDLFRFIRNGKLSLLNLSNVLPKDMKFAPFEKAMFNAVNNNLLPSYWSVVHEATDLLNRFQLPGLPTPNFESLLGRYVDHLKLPLEMAEYAKKLLGYWQRKKNTPPLFHESNIIAPLLVLFKLLLGMDGVTEYRLSHLARTINRFTRDDERVFNFTEWQSRFDLRESNSIEHDYPMQEQFMPETRFNLHAATNFIEATQENNEERFYVSREPDKVVQSRNAIIRGLITFSCPSQHVENLLGLENNDELQELESDLIKSSVDRNVSFLVNLGKYKTLLEDRGIIISSWDATRWLDVCTVEPTKEKHDNLFYILPEKDLDLELTSVLASDATSIQRPERDKSFTRTYVRPSDENNVVYLREDHCYWLLHQHHKYHRLHFTSKQFEEMFKRLPSSWIWLVNQCSAMLSIAPEQLCRSVWLLEEQLLSLK